MKKNPARTQTIDKGCRGSIKTAKPNRADDVVNLMCKTLVGQIVFLDEEGYLIIELCTTKLEKRIVIAPDARTLPDDIRKLKPDEVLVFDGHLSKSHQFADGWATFVVTEMQHDPNGSTVEITVIFE